MNAKVIIRKYERFNADKTKDSTLFWGTIRIVPFNCEKDTFCYDTALFKTTDEVKKEVRAFCEWKGLRIMKYVEE